MLEVKYFLGFETQLRKGLMVKRNFPHVRGKGTAKGLQKGNENTFNLNRASKDQRVPKLLLLPCELMERGLHDGSVYSNLVSNVQTWGAKDRTNKKPLLDTRTTFVPCISKCINSPNYTEKFPELPAKQGSPTAAL